MAPERTRAFALEFCQKGGGSRGLKQELLVGGLLLLGTRDVGALNGLIQNVTDLRFGDSILVPS